MLCRHSSFLIILAACRCKFTNNNIILYLAISSVVSVAVWTKLVSSDGFFWQSPGSFWWRSRIEVLLFGMCGVWLLVLFYFVTFRFFFSFHVLWTAWWYLSCKKLMRIKQDGQFLAKKDCKSHANYFGGVVWLKEEFSDMKKLYETFFLY